MFDFSKSLEDNISNLGPQMKKNVEANIQNQRRKSLYEIRETDRLIKYIEDQPKLFRLIREGKYDEAYECFHTKLLPIWKHVDSMDTISMDTICSIIITLLAANVIQCGVPHNTAYMPCYMYLVNLHHAASQDEQLYITVHAFFEYCKMMEDVRVRGSLSDIIASSVDYISTRLHQKLTIQEIADHAGISPRQLTRKFKAEMGRTIIDYVHEQRVDEAKNMLKYTDSSIIDIALNTGFSSESYFIEIFKLKTGTTPNAYRNERKNQ